MPRYGRGRKTYNVSSKKRQVPPSSELLPSSFDEVTSEYFSQQGTSTMFDSGGKSQQQNKSLFEETPGPGYHSFSNHVMEVDLASTPLSQRFKNNLSSSPSLTRSKLVLGKSPKAPESLQATDDGSLRVPTANMAELRIQPGQSNVMVKSVLQVNNASKRKTPQSTPTKGQGRQAPASRLFKLEYGSTPSWNAETRILRSAEAGRPGLKEVKLRDGFECLEFVDLILDVNTSNWDIVKDSNTNMYRVVAEQIFD